MVSVITWMSCSVQVVHGVDGSVISIDPGCVPAGFGI